METGKPGLASALVHSNSVAAQTEKRMDIQAPLTAVYIHTGPSLSAQPYPPPPAATHSPATLHLAMPPLYSKETLPFLTFHIAGGLQAQPGLSLAAAPPAAVRPKSAGKHMCPHCGRDCMKPSVLEKHLRCHTGERPYPCTTCGVSFKTQSNLYKHRRTQAHARLSSESEQSSLSSLDSSRETCTSSLSLDERSEGSGSSEKKATPSTAEITSSPARVSSEATHGSISVLNELTPAGHETELHQRRREEENKRTDREKPLLTASRHLTLQRQEATLFSKQWESSVSRGKSQSHESTDSGFSEMSDHYPSPGSVLPEHSMDSLTESTTEHLEEAGNAQTQSKPGQSEQEPTDTSRKQEQKKLEERISKLISENSAVVEDKQLENVRPRKTVLSKQGSIDLPMPYTYKDSFHFDMRISKTPNAGLQGTRNHGLYSSVPTQRSNTTEHAPLTRSNSLPFSVTLLPEKSSQASSYQSDYVTLIRRGSSGQINPAGFAIRPVNQQSSTHRPLVRQSAVDCNHATDALFMNSSVEEAYAGSLSCDGDSADICGEPSNRKFRRKKAQKFAYNKWYMYGGGTFRKLYSAEKVSDEGGVKGRKGATHPEQDVRTPSVTKETTATTESMVNYTSATVCHPGCPPAKVSLVSALDFNQTHGKLPFSCRNPLQRNLSLSVLPLPPIGSLVSHSVDGASRAGAGKMFSLDQRSESGSQLSGAPVPSDRKKQKTDDKLIRPLEMETDPNTLTHPLPSVTGSVPRQDANLTYISLQQNHKQLKGVLFQPCIINANTPSVSTSPATSTHSPAKTSFLPKYQLKLPNAAEPDSDPSPLVVDNVTGADRNTFVSAAAEQATHSVTACSSSSVAAAAARCDTKQVSSSSVTSGKEISPCIATKLCQAEALRRHIDVTSCVAVARRQFAATTVTTTCLPDNQAGLCSASVQPPKPAAASESMHLTRPGASVPTSSPVTATIPTANKPPLSHTQLSPANRASNTPIVPCHILPLDQTQSSAQKVFHVHTADLQICLQIISDEQLALMEPHIERQGAGVPGGVQSEAEGCVSGGGSRVHRDHQHSGQSDQSQSLSTDRVKSRQSVPFVRTDSQLHLTEISSSTPAEALAESKLSKAPDSMLRPHNYILVNTVTETQSSTGDVMSTAASHVGVKSGRSQTSEKQHALSLNRCAREQLSPDVRVSQGGLISPQFSGQHKLSVTPLSQSTANQKSGILEKEIQQKRVCNAGARKAKSNRAAFKSSGLESDEGLIQASCAAGVNELSGAVVTFSLNKSPQQTNPQTSIQAEGWCDRVGPSEAAAFSQRASLTESDHEISPAHPQKQPAQSMESGKDNPALLTESSAEELAEGASPVGPAETSTSAHEQQAEETKQIHLKERRDEGPVEEDKSEETDEGKQAAGEAKSDTRVTCLQETTAPEGDDRKLGMDLFRNSSLPKQRPQDLSQTHSGMSEHPSLYLQPASSISNDFHLPASCSQKKQHGHSQLPPEADSFYFSQQPWDSSVSQNQPKQSICKSNSSPHIRVQVQLTETQNTLSHQDQNAGRKQADVTPPTQQGQNITQESIPESQKSPSSDAKTSSCTHPSQESLSAQVTRATAGPTEASHTVLDTVQPVTHPEPEALRDTRDPAPNEHVSLSSSCDRLDNPNRYQSFFLAGQLHGYQPAECMTGGVRPVQSCVDYTEDTSSSDDEGKLIIEL